MTGSAAFVIKWYLSSTAFLTIKMGARVNTSRLFMKISFCKISYMINLKEMLSAVQKIKVTKFLPFSRTKMEYV